MNWNVNQIGLKKNLKKKYRGYKRYGRYNTKNIKSKENVHRKLCLLLLRNIVANE